MTIAIVHRNYIPIDTFSKCFYKICDISAALGDRGHLQRYLGTFAVQCPKRLWASAKLVLQKTFCYHWNQVTHKENQRFLGIILWSCSKIPLSVIDDFNIIGSP